MLVAIGALKADPFEAPVGQLRLDETRLPTIDRSGGGAAARFAAWTARLGEQARLIAPTDEYRGRKHLETLIQAMGVDLRTASEETVDSCLDGATLVHLEAADVFAGSMPPFARRAMAGAKSRGALVSLEMNETAWIRANGAPRTAYQLATLGPDLLFAGADAAAELAIPLEGVAGVAVTLGSRGCSVFGRLVPFADEAPVSPSALIATFCVAFVEGASPIEAAGRAVLMAAVPK